MSSPAKTRAEIKFCRGKNAKNFSAAGVTFLINTAFQRGGEQNIMVSSSIYFFISELLNWTDCH
jgi:hypothetical protein